MYVRVQRGDGGGVQVLVVGEQDMVMGAPAVLVAPGELQGDDVPGYNEATLEALPSRAPRDSLPGVALRVQELGERVVQVVRDGDSDEAAR